MRELNQHVLALREMGGDPRRAELLCAALSACELLAAHFHYRLVVSSTNDGNFRVHVTTPTGREFREESWSLVNALADMATGPLADALKTERSDLTVLDLESDHDESTDGTDKDGQS